MKKGLPQVLFPVLSILLLVSCTFKPFPVPVAGSPGMGDPYYPNWGNGGYDVEKYVIVLEIDPVANTLKGSTTITAKASEKLSSFNLDFHGLAVESVNVNDRPAEFSRNEDELTVTPSGILKAEKPFTAIVKYNGSPELVLSDPIGIYMGWSHTEAGAINVWGEPNAASSWFPNNNHPRDKASYRFEITVPKPWVVAATGTLKETKENGDKTLFIWEMDQPMATYLASINIDQYEIVTQQGPAGVIIRNYYPVDYPSSLRLNYNTLPSMIKLFSDLFGPYPFNEYGVVVAPEEGVCEATPLALEAQSLSIHCPVMNSEAVIAHELAHMWFGDSVSLENWKDVWLKEGFASYAEWLWASKNEPTALARIVKNRENMFFDTGYPLGEPSPGNIYTDKSYTGGALALHALRLTIGEEAFFQTVQTYVERYRYGNAGTDEFKAVAEDVSGQDLTAFFDQWVSSKRMPDMPK